MTSKSKKKKKKGVDWTKVKQGVNRVNMFFQGANKGLDRVMGTK